MSNWHGQNPHVGSTRVYPRWHVLVAPSCHDPCALGCLAAQTSRFRKLGRGQTAGASEMLAQITGVETQARWTRCLYPWPVPLPVRGIP